ncbi:MAG: hypothetical protein AAF963_01845 [Bacteroidota bacterium]
MKKALLALGGVLIFFATAPARALELPEAISFGVSGNGTFFRPIIEKTRLGGKRYEGRWHLAAGGSGFFEYRLFDDRASVGLDVGYTQKGLHLAEKGSESNDDESNYYLTIQTAAITGLVAWLPMEQAEGLSVFGGINVYLVLAALEKELRVKEYKEVASGVVRPYNGGVTGGIRYVIDERGLFVEVRGNFYPWGIFGDEGENKKRALGLQKDDQRYHYDLQVFLGYDMTKLFE